MELVSKQVPAVIAIALAVTLTACDSGDSRTVPTSSMSEAEFDKRVETICAKGRRHALRFRPAAVDEPKRDAIDEAIDTTLLPAMQDVVDEIYELGAPPAQKRQTEALLVALQQAVGEGEDLSPATMERVEALFTPSAKLARKAGLEACVYG